VISEQKQTATTTIFIVYEKQHCQIATLFAKNLDGALKT